MSWRDRPCRIWAGSKRNGYGQRGTHRDGRRVTVYVHRETWEAEHGPIPPGKMVLHHCDTPPCYEGTHLFLGDHQANMDDMVAKGRSRGPHLRGERNPRAKTSAAAVAEIRARYRAGATQAELGRTFGLAQTTVSSIIREATWNPETS